MRVALFERMFRILRHNIFAFGKAFGFPEPTWQQRKVLKEINESQGDPTYISLKSGQGVGKTAMECWVAAWRAFRSYGAPTYVTAPTMRQVKDVFIKELRINLERAEPGLCDFWDIQTTRALLFGHKDWGVIGLSASRAENFQGYHHENMSFVVDEASGVEADIIETIMGTLSQVRPDGSPGDRFCLLCGNPNTRDCAFFLCFTYDRENWSCYTFNAEESPIVDKENLRRLAELYGRDSDVYRVRVLGEFPLQDPRCVMNSDDLEACSENDPVACAADPKYLDLLHEFMPRKALALDFARYGNDYSVIMRRSGLAVVEMTSFAKTEPDVVVARAFEMQKRAGWPNHACTYIADADGMGQGAMHIFYRGDKQVMEFHNNGKPYDSRTYYDRATEAMFELAHLVKQRAVFIPKDRQLIKELSTRQYATASGVRGGGRLRLESKEDYTRRTGESSPDRGDAAMMLFYPFAAPKPNVAMKQRRRR